AVGVEGESGLKTIEPVAPQSDSAEASVRARASSLAFETLTTIDATGLGPLLAASWETEGRGSRWRFHLRNGVKLHDGSPLETWQVAAALRASEPAWKIAAEGDAVTIETDTALADVP